MKNILVFVSLLISANSFCQIITVNKLTGTWLPYNSDKVSFSFDFVDAVNLKIKEDGKSIEKTYTYKVEKINGTNFLEIKGIRKKEDVDTNEIYFKGLDTLIIFGRILADLTKQFYPTVDSLHKSYPKEVAPLSISDINLYRKKRTG